MAIEGNLILAGAPSFEEVPEIGRAFLFARGGAFTRTETGELKVLDTAGGDRFGASVAADGDTLAVGAPGDDVDLNPKQGSASIFYEPSAGTGTGTGQDATAPVLSRLRVSPSRFRGRARISYRLSEPATVRFTVQRAIRRRGRTRYRAVRGAFTRQGSSGGNGFRFTGRVGHRALKAGRYRLMAKAADAAGNSAVPRAVRFRRERLFRRSSRH